LDLTEYVLSNRYKKDINDSNPLGSGGSLIRKYANFIKNMWHGDESVFSPWGLKNAISEF
jgi:ubiquitin C-terminal hydrolase